MSEIDFDELDRAVNGALGKTPSKPISQPLAPAQPIPDSIETQVESPVIEQRERVQLSPIEKTPTPTSAPAARRSSGRFMDMIHPSSDMRSNVTTKPTVQSIPSPAPTPQIEQTAPEAPAWNEPLESPFLPDAKVEKRPLGGIAEEAPEPASFDFQGLLDESDEELLEAPEPQERIEAHAMPDPIDFAAASTVSDEIEARTYEEEQDDDQLDSTPEGAHSSEPEPVVEEFKPVEEIPRPTKIIEEEPIGPTSITPQYKEQASSNQESGSIYDTESYHQPVVVPSKKRSGLTTLIWIIALILLGATAGWAVYVFVLPSVI